MRTTIVGLCVFATAMLVPLNRIKAQARLGLGIQNGQVRNFYFAIGDYYRAPVREVVVVRDSGIPEDEIITSVNARWMRDRCGFSVPDVARWRSHGESFRSIYGRFRSNHGRGWQERGEAERGCKERGGDDGEHGNHHGNHRGRDHDD